MDCFIDMNCFIAMHSRTKIRLTIHLESESKQQFGTRTYEYYRDWLKNGPCIHAADAAVTFNLAWFDK